MPLSEIEAQLQRAATVSRSVPSEGLSLVAAALEVILAQGLREHELEALTIQAAIFHEIGEPERSQAALCRGKQLLPQCHDLVRRARFFTTQGWLAFLRGELGEALTATRAALAVGAPASNAQCWASNNLGLIYRALGARDQALHSFLQARHQSQELGLELTEGAALINISVLHCDQGDFVAAVEAAHEAILKMDRSSDEYAKIAGRGHLMEALVGLGRYDEVEALCQELLKRRQATTLSKVIAQVHRGRAARLQGDYALAHRSLRSALRVAQGGQLLEHRIQAQQERALLLESQGRLAAAARLLKATCEDAQRAGLRKVEAELLELAARIAERRQLYRQALAYVRAHQAIERERTQQEADNQRILFAVELQLEQARQETQRERARSAQLAEEAARDGMTGLYNHATFQKVLQERLGQEPLAVVLLDVDHFKRYNDTYGHPAGDALLKQLAALLTAQLREGDFLARYGGEEFALLLPNRSPRAPLEVAERLRETVAQHRFDHARITISVGVACTPPLSPYAPLLIEAADRALYGAKRGGRNRVIVASLPSSDCPPPACPWSPRPIPQ